MRNWIRLKEIFLLKVLLKRTIPKFSHLEQKKLNVHGKVKTLVFQDPQSPHQLDSSGR